MYLNESEQPRQLKVLLFPALGNEVSDQQLIGVMGFPLIAISESI